MIEPIDRQAAIEALGEQPLALEQGEYEDGLIAQWESDVEAIKNLPSAQPEQRWIPVAEQLPEERFYDDSNYVEPSDSVLVFTRYKTYYISRYWGHRTTKGESNYVIPEWMDLDEYISDAVVAWMPLPEQWEGEENV